MKSPLTIFLLFSVLVAAACHRDLDLRDKTPEEKLNILDIKIHQDQNNARLYAQRADVFLELGRVNEAILDLGRAVNLDDDNADYRVRLGEAYLRNGNMGKCYESLQKALELRPDSQEILLKLGEAAYYSHDLDRALDHLTHVTEKDANNRTALSLKSAIYLEKGDTAAAVVLLDKVCGLYPDYAPAFEMLGTLYAARRSTVALEYYETALRLDPDNLNIRYNIAMYYQEQNQMEQAEAMYKEILDLDETYQHAWHNRGYIQLFHYGDYELAVDYFTRALACDSVFVEALVNRGIAYEMLNDKEHAREDYRHAVRLQPTFQPAIDGELRVKN